MAEAPPRYPIYIPTKGRSAWERARTIRCMLREEIPFKAVVEEQEAADYRKLVPEDVMLVLPFRDRGLHETRNWIKDHSVAAGDVRHWQLDDNIDRAYRLYKGKRYPCSTAAALRVCEDLTDRYENVALSGLNYDMFVMREESKPFRVNVHVYSCSLVLNALPHRWRGPYNDDTDMCLQVLADGWCTILVNVFSVKKWRTMKVHGGNTDDYYLIDDGRLRMARELERRWPGVVKVDRRWGRPQHVINWRVFTTPLRRREDVDLAALPQTDEYGLRPTEHEDARFKWSFNAK